MKVSPLAGQPAPASMLVNVARLVTAYYTEHPDPTVATERVAFGTSGHRGSAFERSFNEATHPGHHPGDLLVSPDASRLMGRCSWGSTPMRCRSRPL